MRTSLLPAGILVAAIAACLWPTGAAAAQPSGTLRVQLNADIRSTTPGSNRDFNTDAVVLHAVEGLVAYRENGSVGPLLAESVTLSDDARTYTFELRDGVTFHNGAPLTSKEVLWSLNRYLDKATEWRCLPDFDGSNGAKIEAIEAPDEKTVTIRISEPSALFLGSLARIDCGMAGILHPASVKADGTWDKPIGTGPFTFEGRTPGQSVTLKAFPGYAALPGERDGYTGNKAPLVETVEFVVVPDDSAAKAALLAGDLDVLPDISNSAQKELEANDAVKVMTSQTMGTNVILFQTTDPLLGKVKLRQAIAAALDIPQIVAAVTEGNAAANNSLVPNTSPYYGAVEKQGFKYDPAKAKALLAEAGYNGEEIVLITNQRYTSSYDTAVFAQAMLQAAGINARLEVLEWGTQLDAYTAGKYQMMAFPYSARLDPALSFDAVMGDKKKQPRKVWDNPEAQKLLDEAKHVSDEARRQELFDQLHEMAIAEVPLVMLYNGTEVGAVAKNVEGYKPWPAAIPRLFGVSVAD